MSCSPTRAGQLTAAALLAAALARPAAAQVAPPTPTQTQADEAVKGQPRITEPGRVAQPQTQAEQATSQPQPTPAPNFYLKEGKLPLNPDGSHYFKITLLNQVWGRFNQSNPGTTVGGYNAPTTWDVGIRRFRIQLYSQLTDRVFIYSQIGVNNFSYNADRKSGGTPVVLQNGTLVETQSGTGGFFLHDAVAEYAVVRNALSLGAGLGAWGGLSRFSSSSAGAILGLDLPLVAETTNDVNDQFGRKLSLYAKGKLGRLDYRLAVADPLLYQKAVGYNPTPGPNATFSSQPPRPQYQGYLQYQFLEPESNLTPYTVGTYLGRKRVFNVGAGFIVQPEAMWFLPAGTSAVQTTALQHYAVDMFYDAPVSSAAGAASVSAYAVAMHLDYGPGYLRNAAPMNPGTGTTNPAALGGFGNAAPLFGTGNVLYGQLGYKLRDNLAGSTTFMPYVSYQHAAYARLADAVNYYDVGLNWLLAGHSSKLTLAYQNRPFYEALPTGENVVTARRSAVVVQYQVYFN